jgi:hypothetical protein
MIHSIYFVHYLDYCCPNQLQILWVLFDITQAGPMESHWVLGGVAWVAWGKEVDFLGAAQEGMLTI